MFESFHEEITRVTILAVPLLLGLTCHELAHGLVALSLGDPTAKLAGRLTMNPLKHLDPMGAIAFILANIGWAKPVPVNPVYFKRPMQGMMLVSLAGPGANFLLALIFAGLFHLMPQLAQSYPQALYVLRPLAYISQAGVVVNLMLGVFNLLPIPPLDGSNILAWALPAPLAYKFLSLGRFGFMLLLGLLIVSQLLGISFLGWLIYPPVGYFSRLLGVPF